jgi:hypothetical protein
VKTAVMITALASNAPSSLGEIEGMSTTPIAAAIAKLALETAADSPTAIRRSRTMGRRKPSPAQAERPLPVQTQLDNFAGIYNQIRAPPCTPRRHQAQSATIKAAPLGQSI